MKASQARKLAAALNAQCDALRLNDSNPSYVAGKYIDPTTGQEMEHKVHDPSKHEVSLIDVVRELDDEARAKLVAAIEAAKS